MKKAKLKRRVELAEAAADHWRGWAKNREEHYEIAKKDAEQARAWADCCEREIERLRGLHNDGSECAS